MSTQTRHDRARDGQVSAYPERSARPRRVDSPAGLPLPRPARTGRPPRTSAPDSLHVERLETEAELLTLKRPWNAMLAESEHVSLFLTWEWISAWWRHRGHAWPLWLLAARDEEGQLAGVAPLLLLSEGSGPWRVRRLAFLGGDFTRLNHQDFVARERDRSKAARAFLAYLAAHRREWDVLDLEGLVEGSVVPAQLAYGPGHYYRRAGVCCPFITLPATWQAYEQELLSAQRRRQVRRRCRALERAYPGQVEFHELARPEELPAALDTLISLTKQRRQQRGLASSFDSDCFVDFNREFAAVALANGWLRFYLLRVAGQVIAADYSFLYRGVFSNYQKGLDLAWDRFSPGQILQAYSIRRAIEEGAREFDMLHGPQAYKYAWTSQDRLDGHAVVSASWRGEAWLLRGALHDAARLAGDMLPRALRERIPVMRAGA